MTEFHQYIARIAEGRDLNEEQAVRAFQIIMTGGATPGQMAAFLMGLKMKGESIGEITGGARVMRAKAEKFKAPAGAIDVCGTGGDASGTFNISTAVAIVTAACGVPVAKHGNKSISSRSGSADVLMELGVNIDSSKEVMENALKETGLCFMMAPKYHGAMRHVGPVRQELGMRTLFNLLGPLANPAETKRQLIGVYDREWVEPLAEVLRNLGTERAWVVHGYDGMDEITTTTGTFVAELKDGEVSVFEISPDDAGLPFAEPEDLKGGDPTENARALTSLLNGHGAEPESDPKAAAYRNIVLMNCAAALIIADKAEDLETAAALAAGAIDSGKAKELLAQLVHLTNAEETSDA